MDWADQIEFKHLYLHLVSINIVIHISYYIFQDSKIIVLFFLQLATKLNWKSKGYDVLLSFWWWISRDTYISKLPFKI